MGPSNALMSSPWFFVDSRGVGLPVVDAGSRKSWVIAEKVRVRRQYAGARARISFACTRKIDRNPSTVIDYSPMPMLANANDVLSQARNVRSPARWSRATLPLFSSSKAI